MVRPAAPSFISKQVERGEYYFFDAGAAGRAPLAVVCGGREVCGARYRIDRRDFPYHSIELVVSGRGSVTLDGVRHRLQSGTLFRYGPGVDHRMAAEPGSRMVKYFVDFTGSGVGRLFRSGPWLDVEPRQLPEPTRAQAIYDELQRIGSRQTPRARRMAALLLQQLVLLAADEAVPAKRLDSRSWAAYRRCRDQMEAHVERVSSLGDVARACGLSPAHVCRLFRRHGDRSPHQALLRLKMARAASLLLERGLLVREAAEQVGFPDPYHFSKAFKRVYGASPEAFRERGGRAAQPASAIRRRRSASASAVQ
jgi:AraC-like DNA-binding protein